MLYGFFPKVLATLVKQNCLTLRYKGNSTAVVLVLVAKIRCAIDQ